MEIGYFLSISMKKIILSIAIACISGLTAHAQLNGDGFYRIQNVNTGRYMTLADRHSRGANAHTTNVDAGAIATRKKWSDIESDPGSIFYIKKVNSTEYNIISQGIDMHQLINYYIRIESKDGGASYKFWQSDSGTKLYLSDENSSYAGSDSSYVRTKGTDTRDWKVIPLNNSGANYIGITPLVKAKNGKYYATYLAGFPYKLQSSGMRALVISAINNNSGNAYYQEISGDIPANTPVLIECSSDNAKNNLIMPLTSTSNSVTAKNYLNGVYFCLGDWISQHFNYTEFDASSMRVLGTNADGDLVFNNSSKYMSSVYVYDGKIDAYFTGIPHNSAYLSATAKTPTELKVEDFATGISPVITDQDANKPGDIYTMTGVKVRKNATSTEGLPQGIYIFKGKKIVVK